MFYDNCKILKINKYYHMFVNVQIYLINSCYASSEKNVSEVMISGKF